MNIFVTDPCPILSAQALPDKHVVKMSLEACQMISVVYSPWYYNWGTIPKADGTAYATTRGMFKQHPCTKWVAADFRHLAWLIAHGKALCAEYTARYDKIHACARALQYAEQIFIAKTGLQLSVYEQVQTFVRVMPQALQQNSSVDVFVSYQRYLASKLWVKGNYRKLPQRKPGWVG